VARGEYLDDIAGGLLLKILSSFIVEKASRQVAARKREHAAHRVIFDLIHLPINQGERLSGTRLILETGEDFELIADAFAPVVDAEIGSKTDRNGARRRLPFPCKSLTGKDAPRKLRVHRRDIERHKPRQKWIHRRPAIWIGVRLDDPVKLSCVQ
jgi:hypothetical protein